MDPIKLSNINTGGRGTSRLGPPAVRLDKDLSWGDEDELFLVRTWELEVTVLIW